MGNVFETLAVAYFGKSNLKIAPMFLEPGLPHVGVPLYFTGSFK